MSHHEIKELTRQLEAANENIKILKDQQREWRDVIDQVFQDRRGRSAILPDFLHLGDSKIEGVLKLAKAYKEQTATLDRLARKAAKGPRVVNVQMGQDITHEGLEKAGYSFTFEGVPIRLDSSLGPFSHFFTPKDSSMPTPTPTLPFTSPNALAKIMVNHGSPTYVERGILGVAQVVEGLDRLRQAIPYAKGPAEEVGKITALSLARLERSGSLPSSTVSWIVDHIPLWPIELMDGKWRPGDRLDALLDCLAPKKPAPSTFGDLDLKPGDKITLELSGTYTVATKSDVVRDALMSAWGADKVPEAIIVLNGASGNIGYIRKGSSLFGLTRVTRKDGTQIYPVVEGK